MKSIVMAGGAILFALTLAAVAAGQISSADIQRQQRQMKAQHERRVAEANRLREQRVRQIQNDSQQGQPARTAFDSSTAPSPSECLARYVIAARKARSIEALLRYLPSAERNALSVHKEAALARHKRIANGILDVLSVKVEGRKAVIKVVTNRGGKINGVEHPYGTAKVELIGEDAFWKVDRYNDSGVVYKHRPKPTP